MSELNKSLLQNDNNAEVTTTSQQVIIIDNNLQQPQYMDNSSGGLFSNLQPSGTQYNVNQYIAPQTNQSYYSNYPNAQNGAEYQSMKSEEDLSRLIFIIALLLSIPALIFPILFICCSFIALLLHLFNYIKHFAKNSNSMSKARIYGKASLTMVVIQIIFVIFYCVVFTLFILASILIAFIR